MPTLLIADEQDDVFTIRARLTSAGDGHYALVIPPENDALGRDVTMRLLGRYVEALGVKVAVISDAPSVQRAAIAAGFDTFESVDEFERWKGSPDERDGLEMTEGPSLLSATIPWVLLAIVLLSAAIAVYLILPIATVTLTPRTENVSGVAEIQIEQEPEARLPDAPFAYGRPVELQLDVEDRAPTTGIGGQDAKAAGSVVFANRTARAVTIPKGTTVVTPKGTRFQTDSEVALEAGAGRVAAAAVTAVQPGDSGNVASRQISVVDGVLEPLVSVTNDQPTTGGSQPSPIVTDRDREALLAAALDRARSEASSTLDGMVGGTDVLVRDSVRVRLVDATFDRQSGEQGSELNVRVTARASGLIVDRAELDRVAARVWNPTLRSGYENVGGSARVRSIESATLTPQGAIVKARIESLVVAQVDQSRAAAMARWRTSQEAQAELMRVFDLAKRPTIAFDQPWAVRAYRVFVQVAPVK